MFLLQIVVLACTGTTEDEMGFLDYDEHKSTKIARSVTVSSPESNIPSRHGGLLVIFFCIVDILLFIFIFVFCIVLLVLL